MSDAHRPSSTSGPPGGAVVPPARQRRASVTLRDQESTSNVAEMMDPATKSLADALRTTYRLLQWTMVALVLVFAFSSFQTIREGERGVRLVLGEVWDDDLGPGLAWSLPPPFGELIKVPTAPRSETTEFFPLLGETERTRTIEELKQASGKPNLNPEVDGSLLTADGGIVHARWTVRYRRANPKQVIGVVLREAEAQIVLAAARRGIVHAAASLTIDEMLKNTPESWRDPARFRTPEEIAIAVAQQTLDDMNSGLVIEQLSMGDRMPPLFVARQFDEVQAAQSQAAQEIDSAAEQRTRTLTEAAGEASGLLLSLIDEYEVQLQRSDEAGASRIQAQIDAVLLGQPVEIDGRQVVAGLYGEAARRISEAKQERLATVDRAQRDATTLAAVRANYIASPTAVLAREWSEALQTFMTRPDTQVLQLGARDIQSLVVQLNRDPTLAREEETQRLRRQMEELARERAERRARERFNQRADPRSNTAQD